MEEIDTYLVFNVEQGDLILDIFNKINDYCNPMYISLHNKAQFGDFINLIYENIDLEESLQFIKTTKKNDEIEEELTYQNNLEDDYFEFN
tara:strand:- start:2450 stop:2719 length:270 start_codon:yes stop_codon:yes gene_type:complete